MINEVKVSAIAVRQFEGYVTKMLEFTTRIKNSVVYLEGVYVQICELIGRVSFVKGKENAAYNKVKVKIKMYEKEIISLNNKISKLEEKLDKLEEKLINTPETILDEEIEIPNPKYGIIQTEIVIEESKIKILKKEVEECQKKLERAYDLNKRLEVHIESIEGVIPSLEEKRDECKELITKLSDIQSSVERKSLNASTQLKNLEKVIDRYLKVKMKYDYSGIMSATYDNHNNDISSASNNKIGGKKGKIYTNLTEEEIEKHNIKFNRDGHIIEYDEKKFGEDYNSYEDRLKYTPLENNPVKGRWNGVRGESKFISSKRTVEGQRIVNILQLYGIDGITYRNAEPDFEGCSEAVVKIKHMTNNRLDYKVDGIQKEGNFTQADIELAKLWTLQKKDGKENWEASDIREYRKANGLTWHEKCDTKTMVMVKKEINEYFGHSGGCSACGVRDKSVDEDQYNG